MKSVKSIKLFKYLIMIYWGLYDRNRVSDNGINTITEKIVIKTIIDHTMIHPLWAFIFGDLTITIGPIVNRKNYLKNETNNL